MWRFNIARVTALLTCIFLLRISVAQTTEPKLKITRLTGDHYIFTTYQKFKGNKVSANGMYVLTRQGAILFDTPWDTTQCQPLLDSIEKKHKQKVIFCVATHSHEDRAGGLDHYRKKGIKTYTSALTDSILNAYKLPKAQFHFKQDTSFDIGGCKFQVAYVGAGHTIDNIVVWFANEKILYGGCIIKSTEATDLGYIKESDLKAWPVSLHKLRKRFSEPKFVIPGHQDWKDPRSIDHTLELLKQAEKE